MFNTRLLKFCLSFLCLLVFNDSLLANPVNSSFALRVESDGDVVTITDNDTGDILVDDDYDILSASHDVGDYSISVESGMSSSAFTFTDVVNSSTSIKTTGATNDSLFITVSRSDISTPVTLPEILAMIDATILPAQGNLANFDIDDFVVTAFLDLDNALFGTDGADLILSTSNPTAIPAGQGSFAFDESTLLNSVTAPYSLTLMIEIKGTNAAMSVNLQTAVTLSSVPEPTSMAIMGLGTLLAGFGVRRRKRKMAELAA